MSELTDVAIVGAGPGGLCAALYCVRAGLSVSLLDKGSPGGQTNNTEAVENYLGLDYVEGPEMAQRMAAHVAKVGVEPTFASIERITRDEDGFFSCHIDGEEPHRAKCVIVGTGSTPRYLGVPGELEHRMGGVSYCATCDGFFYRGKDVLVVGGGDAAVEEAIYLAKITNSVKVIHRRDQLRAQKVLQDQAFTFANIEFVWDTIVEEIVGENGRVTGVSTFNKKTEARGFLAANGVFIYVGNLPNSQCLQDVAEMDDYGYVIVDRMMRTSVPGLFAIGDMRVESVRQIASAVGDGATAAVAAVSYVNTLGA